MGPTSVILETHCVGFLSEWWVNDSWNCVPRLWRETINELIHVDSMHSKIQKSRFILGVQQSGLGNWGGALFYPVVQNRFSRDFPCVFWASWSCRTITALELVGKSRGFPTNISWTRWRSGLDFIIFPGCVDLRHLLYIMYIYYKLIYIYMNLNIYIYYIICK